MDGSTLNEDDIGDDGNWVLESTDAVAVAPIEDGDSDGDAWVVGFKGNEFAVLDFND